MRRLCHTLLTGFFTVMLAVNAAAGKALVIDNGAVSNVVTFLQSRGIECTVITAASFVQGKEREYDFCILSGGSASITSGYLAEEYLMIDSALVPIFGICMGHQMIASHYDGWVGSLGAGTIQCTMNVAVHNLDELGMDYTEDSLNVWENHSWGVRGTVPGFTIYGESKYCVEFIKHDVKPLVGTQFHPENRRDGNQGYIVLDWFLNVFVPRFWERPRFTCDGSATVRMGQPFKYRITYNHPLGGTAAVTALGALPGWLTFRGDSLSGTPTACGQDTARFALKVNAAVYDTLVLVIAVLPNNLANGTTHRGDSQNFDANDPLERLWDGDVASAYGPGSGSSDSFWVEYDLGQVYRLDLLRFHGDNSGTWISTRYSVYVKQEVAESWQPVINDQPCRGTRWYETTVDIAARYLRLVVVGDTVAHTVQAREFEVFGEPETPTVVARLAAEPLWPARPGKAGLYDITGRFVGRVSTGRTGHHTQPTGIYIIVDETWIRNNGIIGKHLVSGGFLE